MLIRRGGVLVRTGVVGRVGATSSRASAPQRRSVLPTIEPIDLSPSALRGWQLKPWQVEAAEWLRSRAAIGRPALLGDDVGLGKTGSMLRAVRRNARVLVVAPAYLRPTWRDECLDWRPDLEPTLPAPSDELRVPRRGEVLVVSFDSLPKPGRSSLFTLCPHLDLSDVQLIVDEVHYCKGGKTGRTAKVEMLCRQVRAPWGATGTPLPNMPPDLATVLRVLRLFQESFGSWNKFQKVFHAVRTVVANRLDPMTGQRRLVYKTTWGDEPDKEARELLRQVMLRRTQDLLDLPPLVEKVLRIEAPEDLRASLDEALEAWDRWGDPNELPPFELFSAALSALAESRIPAAVEHVRNALAEKRPMLVFSNYVAPVAALAKLGPRVRVVTGQHVPDPEARKPIADAFQRGEYDVLAGTIDAMGVGLTMTRASRVLFIDESHVPSENSQAYGRARRLGQDKSVLVERMRSDHPLDVRRGEILDRKIGISRVLDERRRA